MVHCHKCGAKAADDDVFCPECGAKILKEELKKQEKKEPPAPKPEKKEEPEAPKPKETPVPQPQNIIVQQKSPDTTKAILGIILILFIIFAFRSCAKQTVVEPEPEPWPEPEPVQITCNTFTDSSGCEITECTDGFHEKVCPEKPELPLIDKAKECSGVAVNINDACYSCGLVSCSLIVEIENTGSKPIYRFKVRHYYDPKDYYDGGSWEPLNVGATDRVSPFTGDNPRLLEYTPVILVGDEEVECDSKKASYGNAYGDGFGECYDDWRNY